MPSLSRSFSVLKASRKTSRATTSRLGLSESNGCGGDQRTSSLWTTPSTMPDSTASGMLLSRATMATAKVSMTSSVRRKGSSSSCGASSAPDSPANPQPRPHAMEATRLALTAVRSASRRWSTTARIWVPRWVQRKTTSSTVAATRTMTSWASWFAPIRRSPVRWMDVWGNRLGASVLCTGPQMVCASPTSTTKTPSVATSFSDVLAPLVSSGRKTTRSSSTPMPGPATSSTSGAAIHSGTPHPMLVCHSR